MNYQARLNDVLLLRDQYEYGDDFDRDGGRGVYHQVYSVQFSCAG